jgi:hypothetical protein
MSGGVQGTGEEVRLRMAGGVRTKTVCGRWLSVACKSENEKKKENKFSSDVTQRSFPPHSRLPADSCTLTVAPNLEVMP